MKKLLIFMIFSVIAFGSEIDNKNSISVPVKVSAEINKLRLYSKEYSLTTDFGYDKFNMPTTWINRDTESHIVYVRSRTSSGEQNLIAPNLMWEIKQLSGILGNHWTIKNPAEYNFNTKPFKIPIGQLATSGTNGAGKDEPFYLYVGFNRSYDGTGRTVQMQMKGKFTKPAIIEYGISFRVFVKS